MSNYYPVSTIIPNKNHGICYKNLLAFFLFYYKQLLNRFFQKLSVRSGIRLINKTLIESNEPHISNYLVGE